MTPLDLGLAASGRMAAALERRTGSSRRTWAIVIGLVLVSAFWTYQIGSSPRPTDLTFEDVRLDRIPAMTSWVRLEGDLRPVAGSDSLYEFHDTVDPSLYLIVITSTPPALGHAVLTGHLSPSESTGGGNIGSLDPDIPPVPKQNEPFAIILLPAAIGAAVVIGRRVGYPVVRRERSRHLHAEPLGPDERVRALRSGRIGSTALGIESARPCSLAVRRGSDVHDIVLVDDDGPEHEIRVRRSVPVTRLRVCRTSGCQPGVLVHAQSADLVLVVPDRYDRDRLLVTLG
jgi:hypothetical protein